MSRIDLVQAQNMRSVASAQGRPATLSLSPTMDKGAGSLSEARLPLSELSQANSSEVRREALEHLIDELNIEYQRKSIALNFSIDDDTDTLVVKVIDQTNDKVIRQIPPDAILALKRNIQAMMGALFDEEA